MAGFAFWHDPDVLFGARSGPGAFYRIMPHNAMVAIFWAAFLWSSPGAEDGPGLAGLLQIN